MQACILLVPDRIGRLNRYYFIFLEFIFKLIHKYLIFILNLIHNDIINEVKLLMMLNSGHWLPPGPGLRLQPGTHLLPRGLPRIQPRHQSRHRNTLWSMRPKVCCLFIFLIQRPKVPPSCPECDPTQVV